MRALLLFVVALTTCSKPKPFLEQRAAAPTKLTLHTASPQDWDDEIPEGVTEVFYESEGRKLSAWWVMPLGDTPKNAPVLVYFHGGWSRGASELDDVKFAMQHGYAVLIPTYRGENGNPGDFELWRGELDDARAAITWAAKQDGIDANRIVAFGHSAGGGLSALLSLCDSPKLLLSGSSGGMYDETFFDDADMPLPFDAKDETERRLRVFAPNAKLMLQRHVAYVGKKDLWALNVGRAAARRAPDGMFELVEMNGDHFTSLEPSMKAFIERVDAIK